jgi:signal transduction histidine kinase
MLNEAFPKIVLALDTSIKAKWKLLAATTPRARAATSRTGFYYKQKSQEQMSAPQTPSETHELARLRALVIDYETKLTDAAALVAHVRHEINNPLAALLGQAQLMLREELSDKARRRVETIEKLAIRIKDTVAELRDVQTPVAAVNRAEE